MGFDLTVFTPSRPADIKTLWEREFSALGFEVEIYPGFSPDSCNGGFLPFRVAAAPELYIGLTLAEPAVSGFEIRFDADAAHLWTGAGRTTTEFALQCLGAATLAQLCRGEYVDDQTGLRCSGSEAIDAAKKEIAKFLRHARKFRALVSHPFPGWEALG